MQLTKHCVGAHNKMDRPGGSEVESGREKRAAETVGDPSVHGQGTCRDRTTDTRIQADGDSAASRDLTRDGASSALGGLPEGWVQRCGAADALGDSERIGRSITARDGRGTAGGSSEGTTDEDPNSD
jgi:hypothetical protein